VDTGDFETCGIRSPGALYCWGGTPGDSWADATTASKLLPYRIGTDEDWTKVTVGRGVIGVRKANGTFHTFGNNISGSLGVGVGDTTDRALPAAIALSGTVSHAFEGYNSGCAVQASSLYCWGNGAKAGGAGVVEVPTQVGTATNWVSAWVGQNASCGVDTLGKLGCFGSGWHGLLGDGMDNTLSTESTTPVPVAADDEFTSVALGDYHACAVRTDGRIVCWGVNAVGQLGLGATSPLEPPTLVPLD
jgi:alpha-tubulin suppressor-like RCC1 family protein